MATVERSALAQPPKGRTSGEGDPEASGGFILRRAFDTAPSRVTGHRLRARIFDDRFDCSPASR
jgi:hypothetical protein